MDYSSLLGTLKTRARVISLAGPLHFANTPSSLSSTSPFPEASSPWGRDGVPGSALEHLGDTAVFGDTPEFPRGGHMTPTDRIGDFGHVDVTVGVHRNAVGRNELPGTFALFVRSKATHHLAFQVINGDTVPEPRGVIHAPHAIEFSHINMLTPQHHGIRPMDVVPHRDKAALRIEQLDAVRFPIHDIDGIVGVDGNIVWPNELASVNAWTAPGEFVGPGPRIDMNPGVAIAVGDLDVPIGGHDGCRGRPVKRGAAPLGRRMIARANLHHLLALGRELLNGMDAIVRHQQRAIVGDIQAVGAVTKEALAKRAQVVPVAIEDHERVLSTGQDVDLVLGIHRYPWAFLKRDTLGEFAPPLDIFIAKVPNPIHFTHRLSPFTVAQDCNTGPIISSPALRVNTEAGHSPDKEHMCMVAIVP